MPELDFVTAVNEGSAYDIGLQRGRFVYDIPELRYFLTTLPEGVAALGEEEALRRIRLLETCCPGLEDELHGFADGLQVPWQSLFQLRLAVNERPRACSLIAVPPKHSVNGHTLVARSYEYNQEDELFFSITRETGKFAHMGFSLFQVGRFDGINEKGLCVAISSCECVRSSVGQADGIAFYITVRRLLDSCATVKEALAVMDALPMGDNFTYVLADATGDTAIVESLMDEGAAHKVVRRAEGPLFGLNHYISPENRAIAPKRMGFSYTREQLLSRYFEEREKVSLEDLRSLLATPFPDGLCCKDYDNYFGTLRSMLFDAQEKKLTVCFGPTEEGRWFDADWQAPAGFTVTHISCESVPLDGKYWQEA